jgi:hypothetical protein
MEIDYSKLSRDYRKEPLGTYSMYEKPCKEDLLYLYIDLNLSVKEVGEIIGRKVWATRKYLKSYGITKDINSVTETRKRTKLSKYGDPNFTNREKFIHTCQEKYGVNNVFSLDDVKEKIKNHWLETIGTEYYSSTKECREKMKKTSIEIYGVEYPNQANVIKEKRKNTNISKYGYPSNSQTQEFKDMWKNKEWADKVKEKSYKSRKINHSFKQSKAEDLSYELTKSIFPDAQHQYSSELYPFNSDIYIPEIDTYIELNYHWTHGINSNGFHCHCPYDENNDEHKRCVNFLLSKNSPYYLNAVKVWTIRDPLKRKIAQDNGINFQEFYTKQDYIDWLEQFKQ